MGLRCGAVVPSDLTQIHLLKDFDLRFPKALPVGMGDLAGPKKTMAFYC